MTSRSKTPRQCGHMLEVTSAKGQAATTHQCERELGHAGAHSAGGWSWGRDWAKNWDRTWAEIEAEAAGIEAPRARCSQTMRRPATPPATCELEHGHAGDHQGEGWTWAQGEHKHWGGQWEPSQ